MLFAAASANDHEVREDVVPETRRRPVDTATSAFIAPPSGQLFVGRDRERQLLLDAWSRRVRLVLIRGEAGVGKSSLVETFLVDAQVPTLLRGRSTQQQLGVYEAFVEPVRTAVGKLDGAIPQTLRDLGRLVPGLVPGISEVIVPSRIDPAVERRILFEAVTSLFGGLGPTLVYLDDVHWADQGTLALLAHLVAQPEMANTMIVATVRSTDVTLATDAALHELRRHCEVVPLRLQGLSRSDLAALVTSIAGTSVSEALIETVADATSGNPLYAKELTEHLVQRGSDDRGIASVPDGIRQTIDLRVAALSKESQALLRAGAVLGSSFDVNLAGRLVTLQNEDLLAAVEDAILNGLLVEQAGNIVTFSHGLVGTSVYDGISRIRRTALHRVAADALIEHNPSTSAEIMNVARHLALVAESDPSIRSSAARWSARAGEAAAASAAIDEAIACYRRAAALWDGPTSEHAKTLALLGSALTATGNIAEGSSELENALRIAEEAGDAEVFAKAALGLAASVRYGYSDPVRIEQLERAIAKLGPDDRVLRPALLATLRRQLGFVNTDEAGRRRVEAAEQVAAVLLADEVSDDLLISVGSLRDSLVLDDPRPLGALARQIIRVGESRQDLPVLSTGWYRQAWSALELGEGERFRSSVLEYRRIAEKLRRPYEMALSSNMLAAVAQIEGRYDDAEAFGNEALAHAATIEDGNFSWVYFANSGLRAIDRGDVQTTFGLMQAVRTDFAGLPTFEAALPAVAAVAGDRAMADALVLEQIGVGGSHLDRDWSYLSAECLPVIGLLSWATSVTANHEHAVVLRERLTRFVALGVRAVRLAPVGAWIGPIDHHLGTLAHVLGDLDAAQGHLERALLVEEELRGGPFQVRTMLELAAVHRARSGGEDGDVARQWKDKAETLAGDLGLPTLIPG